MAEQEVDGGTAEITVFPSELRTWESALSRTNSYLILPFHNFVARTQSVPDVTGYYRIIDRARPRWLSRPRREEFRITWPSVPKVKYSTLARKYWRDQYYYFSPLYKRHQYSPRPFQSDIGIYPYTYFVRYNGTPGGIYTRPYYNYPIEDFMGL